MLFRSEEANEFLSLKNEVVTGNKLEVAVIYIPRIESELFLIWTKSHADKKGLDGFAEIPGNEQLKLVADQFEVYVDGKLLTDYKWLLKTMNVETFIGNPTRMIARIDVSTFDKGDHELAIKIKPSLADWKLNLIPNELLRSNDKCGYHAKINFYIDR